MCNTRWISPINDNPIRVAESPPIGAHNKQTRINKHNNWPGCIDKWLPMDAIIRSQWPIKWRYETFRSDIVVSSLLYCQYTTATRPASHSDTLLWHDLEDLRLKGHGSLFSKMDLTWNLCDFKSQLAPVYHVNSLLVLMMKQVVRCCSH